MIRLYKKSDYEILKSWWAHYNQPAPTVGMIPTYSTFILESQLKPVMSISVIMTNVDVVLIENLIKDPAFRDQQAVSRMFKYAEEFAKSEGYSSVILLPHVSKLKQKYQNLGYVDLVDNISILFKNLRSK